MKKSLGPKTIVFPAPVFIIGSYDEQEKPNIMNVAWGGICCSRPPCLTISLREATYTYDNIKHSKAFTVNIPSSSQVRETDYVGIYSCWDEDKFKALGLTPVKSKLVNAPYIKEFPFVVECNVVHTYKLGLHTQFVGEIIDVKVNEDMLNEKGMPDMKKVDPLCVDPGTMSYYNIGEYVAKAFSVGKKEEEK